MDGKGRQVKRWLTVHDFAAQLHRGNPSVGKGAFAAAIAQHYELSKARSVFFADDFAVRFCYSNDAGFSNCVVSLATLRKFDDRPFLVCLLKPSGVQTFLANATFIRKVSHSSQKLTVSNIRGTILGHDIAREYEGVANTPTNLLPSTKATRSFHGRRILRVSSKRQPPSHQPVSALPRLLNKLRTSLKPRR